MAIKKSIIILYIGIMTERAGKVLDDRLLRATRDSNELDLV